MHENNVHRRFFRVLHVFIHDGAARGGSRGSARARTETRVFLIFRKNDFTQPDGSERSPPLFLPSIRSNLMNSVRSDLSDGGNNSIKYVRERYGFRYRLSANIVRNRRGPGSVAKSRRFLGRTTRIRRTQSCFAQAIGGLSRHKTAHDL